MKAVKGKLMKKLKTIKAIEYLKPEKILHADAFHGYLYTSPPKPIPAPRAPLAAIEEETKKQRNENTIRGQEHEIIDVTELLKELVDEEMEFDGDMIDKENVMPTMKADKVVGKLKAKDGSLEEKWVPVPLSEIDVSSFRQPDLNSVTLFDPDLLAAFEQAVTEVKAREAERRSRIEEFDEPPSKARKIEQITDPITQFDEKSPQGGSESVVLYTTGLRAIRKTFDDCQKVRSLLENLRIVFIERDVSMHSEFRDEMWVVLGGKVVRPRLFIKGRYIGGAEEVVVLHEQGRMKPLIEGIPVDGNHGPCEGCVGFRFIVCFNCNGSRKIVAEGTAGGSIARSVTRME